MKRVLVIDQATIKTAFNVIDLTGDSPVWVCCSMIKLDGDTNSRISQLYDFINNVVDEYDIDTLVLEEVPVSRKTNLNVTVVLLKLLGVMELLGTQRKLSVHIMNVNAWKKSAGIVTRTRASQKTESIALAIKRWKSYADIIKKSDDVSDALNMGYAFLKQQKIL